MEPPKTPQPRPTSSGDGASMQLMTSDLSTDHPLSSWQSQGIPLPIRLRRGSMRDQIDFGASSQDVGDRPGLDAASQRVDLHDNHHDKHPNQVLSTGQLNHNQSMPYDNRLETDVTESELGNASGVTDIINHPNEAHTIPKSLGSPIHYDSVLSARVQPSGSHSQQYSRHKYQVASAWQGDPIHNDQHPDMDQDSDIEEEEEEEEEDALSASSVFFSDDEASYRRRPLLHQSSPREWYPRLSSISQRSTAFSRIEPEFDQPLQRNYAAHRAIQSHSHSRSISQDPEVLYTAAKVQQLLQQQQQQLSARSSHSRPYAVSRERTALHDMEAESSRSRNNYHSSPRDFRPPSIIERPIRTTTTPLNTLHRLQGPRDGVRKHKTVRATPERTVWEPSTPFQPGRLPSIDHVFCTPGTSRSGSFAPSQGQSSPRSDMLRSRGVRLPSSTCSVSSRGKQIDMSHTVTPRRAKVGTSSLRKPGTPIIPERQPICSEDYGNGVLESIESQVAGDSLITEANENDHQSSNSRAFTLESEMRTSTSPSETASNMNLAPINTLDVLPKHGISFRARQAISSKPSPLTSNKRSERSNSYSDDDPFPCASLDQAIVFSERRETAGHRLPSSSGFQRHGPPQHISQIGHHRITSGKGTNTPPFDLDSPAYLPPRSSIPMKDRLSPLKAAGKAPPVKATTSTSITTGLSTAQKSMLKAIAPKRKLINTQAPPNLRAKLSETERQKRAAAEITKREFRADEDELDRELFGARIPLNPPAPRRYNGLTAEERRAKAAQKLLNEEIARQEQADRELQKKQAKEIAEQEAKARKERAEQAKREIRQKLRLKQAFVEEAALDVKRAAAAKKIEEDRKKEVAEKEARDEEQLRATTVQCSPEQLAALAQKREEAKQQAENLRQYSLNCVQSSQDATPARPVVNPLFLPVIDKNDPRLRKPKDPREAFTKPVDELWSLAEGGIREKLAADRTAFHLSQNGQDGSDGPAKRKLSPEAQVPTSRKRPFVQPSTISKTPAEKPIAPTIQSSASSAEALNPSTPDPKQPKKRGRKPQSQEAKLDAAREKADAKFHEDYIAKLVLQCVHNNETITSEVYERLKQETDQKLAARIARREARDAAKEGGNEGGKNSASEIQSMFSVKLGPQVHTHGSTRESPWQTQSSEQRHDVEQLQPSEKPQSSKRAQKKGKGKPAARPRGGPRKKNVQPDPIDEKSIDEDLASELTKALDETTREDEVQEEEEEEEFDFLTAEQRALKLQADAIAKACAAMEEARQNGTEYQAPSMVDTPMVDEESEVSEEDPDSEVDTPARYLPTKPVQAPADPSNAMENCESAEDDTRLLGDNIDTLDQVSTKDVTDTAMEDFDLDLEAELERELEQDLAQASEQATTPIHPAESSPNPTHTEQASPSTAQAETESESTSPEPPQDPLIRVYTVTQNDTTQTRESPPVTRTRILKKFTSHTLANAYVREHAAALRRTHRTTLALTEGFFPDSPFRQITLELPGARRITVRVSVSIMPASEHAEEEGDVYDPMEGDRRFPAKAYLVFLHTITRGERDGVQWEHTAVENDALKFYTDVGMVNGVAAEKLLEAIKPGPQMTHWEEYTRWQVDIRQLRDTTIAEGKCFTASVEAEADGQLAWMAAKGVWGVVVEVKELEAVGPLN